MRYIWIELIKIKQNKIYWIFFCFALAFFAYLSFNSMPYANEERINEMPNGNPWYIFTIFRTMDVFLIILISGFLTAFHFQVEHRNGMMKRMQMLPITSFNFFCTKLFSLYIFLFLFLMFYFIVSFLGFYYSGLYSTNISTVGHNYYETIYFQILWTLRIYICLWGYVALIGILNMYISQLVISIALVILLWLANFSIFSKVVPSGFAGQSDRLISSLFSNELSYFQPLLYKYEFYSLAIFLLTLLLSFFLHKKDVLLI